MVLSSIYWNPTREILHLPFINLPLLWYGVFFACGFSLGYLIFISILRRYLSYYPQYYNGDIVSWKAVFEKIEQAKSFFSIKSSFQKEFKKKEVLFYLNDSLEKTDDHPSFDYMLGNRNTLDERLKPFVLSLKKKSNIIADRLLVYMVLATILGARLGHLLFYESPSYYLHNPQEIFRLWRIEGLASHGAAFAILLAMIFFSRWVRKYLPSLSWIKLLDFIAIPTALGGAFIRVGNFFNQEILGTQSSLPWSVIFGNPADQSLPFPRHPVQLYEAIFYFCTFLLLFFLSYKKNFLLMKGKLIGLFLVLMFTFRFFIEFLKENQSFYSMNENILDMGQLLSLPLILLGFFLYNQKFMGIFSKGAKKV